MTRKKTVAVNEKGIRIGEDHQHAKLSNRDVDRVRELHEDHGHRYGYIADWFGTTKRCIAAICRYERRGQTPDRWKLVKEPTKNERKPQF